MKRPSVLICVPAYQQNVSAQTMESVYALGQFFAFNGVRNQLSWYSAAEIAEVRNLFLTTWYDKKPEFSHLFFVDSDMGFEPHMVRDMLKFDKPLMGAFYAKRQMHPIRTVGQPLDPDVSYHDMKDGHILADYVGGGCMLISRACVDEMLKKIPGLEDDLPSYITEEMGLTRFLRPFEPIHNGRLRLSEDVSFCVRWKNIGGEIWANVNYKLDHVGPFNYHMRYAGILENELKVKTKAA